MVCPVPVRSSSQCQQLSILWCFNKLMLYCQHLFADNPQLASLPVILSQFQRTLHLSLPFIRHQKLIETMLNLSLTVCMHCIFPFFLLDHQYSLPDIFCSAWLLRTCMSMTLNAILVDNCVTVHMLAVQNDNDCRVSNSFASLSLFFLLLSD